MPKVTIYSKGDCHLCDVAKERVDSARRQVPFDLEVVDIETSEGLTREYGERIPVVALDGEELWEYRVNEKALVRCIRKSSKRSKTEK